MLIVLVDDAAGEYSLHMTHAHILVLDLLVDEVRCPDLDAIVVDSY